ncbi:MAG: hypothetical protein PVH88_27660 [Ignavibacteria bacterium]|jgi:hypothetical protein
MPINYSIENDYIIIKSTGTWDKPTIIKTQDESSEIVKNGGLKGLLVDLTEADLNISILDIYEVNKRISKVFPISVKHAIVFPEKIFPQSDVTFSENVATNYGAFMKMFTNASDAKNWLNGEGIKAANE